MKNGFINKWSAGASFGPEWESEKVNRNRSTKQVAEVKIQNRIICKLADGNKEYPHLLLCCTHSMLSESVEQTHSKANENSRSRFSYTSTCHVLSRRRMFHCMSTSIPQLTRKTVHSIVYQLPTYFPLLRLSRLP